MGDQVEGLDAVDLSEGLTIYVRNSKKETPIRLDVLAERYVNGESLKVLGEEVQVSEPTLRRHLDDAGLLAKPEDRNTPLNRLASQLPLPDVNLSRIRKQMRLAREKS
ncbi:hypothetical protein ACFW2V_13230 [Streptomyces sp. NPDC058947]|uniref:hypothetical protein n=1 Tax=Streptomyces sp. NPDC058947 TaxID=3346675 RepID=UPI0036C855FA